jgi:deoxyribodipyrimidine photo-lyase
MISARQACVAAYQATEGALDDAAREEATSWLNELIWREFYAAILYHYPEVLQQSFRSNLRSVEWDDDESGFQAWCNGGTGYPIVDAAMRQLVSTGWMHNRARMVVASFLVKDLLIDWRWGEEFFMQHLVDGDPAANNGGWQWTAGTGTDAAPYFRIFNPTSQGEKHDPEGAYVRSWLPELADVPTKYVHTPWEMDRGMQRETGCVLDQDYPSPIIDHRQARERTLTAYRAARARAESDS